MVLDFWYSHCLILTPEIDPRDTPEFPWEFGPQDRRLSQHMAPVVVPPCPDIRTASFSTSGLSAILKGER